MGARTLDQRVRDSLAPEPIVFEVDANGDHHFATETLPWRTVIEVASVPYWPWIKIDERAGTVTIALDGKSVVYRRRGCGFMRSQWICDLQSQ